MQQTPGACTTPPGVHLILKIDVVADALSCNTNCSFMYRTALSTQSLSACTKTVDPPKGSLYGENHVVLYQIHVVLEICCTGFRAENFPVAEPITPTTKIARPYRRYTRFIVPLLLGFAGSVEVVSQFRDRTP